MKRHPLIAAMLALAATASAQKPPTAPEGYLSRGLMMWADNNYPGTIDQSARALTLEGTCDPEEARLLEALASARQNAPDAAAQLERYLDDYPASAHRNLALMALGDLAFNRREWGTAFTTYSRIDPRALSDDMADDYAYHTGYCRLMLGDYEQAAAAMARLERSSRYGNAALFYQGYIAYAQGDYNRAMSLMERVNPTGEPGSSAPYYIMQMRFARGEWQQALDTAQRCLAAKDADPAFTAETLRVAGESLYNLGRESEACEYLWKYAAMATEPAPSAFYILGMSEYKNGNTDAAIKLLQRVIPADDALAQSAFLTLGQAYQRRGDSTSALLAYEKAYRMSFDPTVQETALYNYAAARIAGGSVPFGSSVGMLEDFLTRFPDSRYAPEVQRYIVTGYMTDNDYDSALAAIERVERPTHEIEMAKQRVLFVLATREYQSGNAAKAERRLLQVEKMGKGYDESILTQSYLWLGDCLYTRGDYDGAARRYETYIKRAGSRGADLMTAYYDLGYARFSAGKYAQALAAFSKAGKEADTTSHPRLRADILNREADCHYYASNFASARKLYTEAYELQPQSGDYSLYQLAIVKGLEGNHKGKIADIDRLTESFPNTGLVPQALLEKAESQAALGDVNGAIATYRTLVGEHATTAPGRNGYLQLALIYLNNNNRAKAIDTYREVIRNYPASDEARLAADDLKRLYAADGRLEEYVAFVKSVPGAPDLDAVEMDALAFEAAEQSYATRGVTERLDDYLNRYPAGAFRAKALYYKAENAWNSGHASEASKLAAGIMKDYPNSEAAEQALLIKGEADSSLGRYADALKAFETLEKSASTPAMLHEARMGAMRCASKLGRDKQVMAAAASLMASAATPAESLLEARYLRALSLDRTGSHTEACREWAELAAKPETEAGSMSAVALAQSQLGHGELSKAAATADAFINANPPHQYWLARGFIVYSDILRKRGDSFEADEYLKSLRANYPGNEPDIRDMINERLK
ncbi:MAG: tetratricopeptide repeat protein [Bacteroidales bacterium]|nr:tetratricopeptide repeat protein [Bacteroidales bacterium]